MNKQGSSTLEAFSYEYDGAGNMTGKADRKGTTAYTYDNLNRLQTVTEATGKVTAYEYDAAGNRNSETVTDGSNVTKTEYAYDDQNRLIGTNKLVNSEEAGGEDYGFDNNGNVLSVLPHTVTASAITTTALTVELSALGSEGNQSDTAVYEYDTRNQMIKSVEGTNTVESAYNGDGLRVSKTVNGQTSNYLYEYDKIILETDGSNAQIAQNVYGNNLINRSVDSDNLYYMYNGHGDVTSLQTMEGTSAAEYYYDAFGTATEVTGEANNPFRYAGYEYDDETDLYYLKSRMYNSVTARFMQEDTYRGQANDPLSLNLYTYCTNNPLIYYDPDGHITTNWDKKKLNRAQQAALSIQTRLYDSKTAKGDTAGAAAAHAAAESIRNTARSSNEVGSASGYTYKVNNNGSSSLNKYDSSALAKATSSGGSTLNGSSYLPEQTIKDTQKVNTNISELNQREKNESFTVSPLVGSTTFSPALAALLILYTRGNSNVDDFLKGVGAAVAETATFGASRNIEVYYDVKSEKIYLVGKIAGEILIAVYSGEAALASGAGAVLTSGTVVGGVGFSASAVFCGSISASATVNATANIISLINTSGGSGAEGGVNNASDFEKKISKMPANERVAAIKTRVNQISEEVGLVKDNKLSRINGRDVYRNPETGEMFALDTQHGRFEVINPKNGKHMGEVDFDFNPTKAPDTSSGHNIKLN